jgi:hypothetical protein
METEIVASPPGKNLTGWSLAVVSILLVLIGGGMYLRNLKSEKATPSERPAAIRIKSPKKTKTTSTASETDPKTVATPSRPKSADDLKVGPIALQKKQGTSLVHAVGKVRNESDYQRFGVTVELDLLDAEGKRVGPARDYIAVIEPRGEWQFRALVMMPRSVASARVAKIKEEE